MTDTPESFRDRLYGYLADDEDARVCKDIPDAACDEQPTSFLAHLFALVLTKLGDSLVSARLVLAWMLTSLGVPGAFIAALVPLRESLALLPQLIVAQQLRETPVRKWFWVLGSVAQGLALLGMVLAMIALEGEQLGWGVIVLLAAFSLARGVCSVASKDVQGKTISKTRRGRLTGLAAAISGGLTVLVALVIIFGDSFAEWFGITLGSDQMGVFMALLVFAAGLWLVAALAYSRVPELPGATEGGGNALIEALKSIRLLWTDRQFGQFVLTRALLVASAFAIPYLVVLLQQTGPQQLSQLGWLMLASGLAGLVAGRFWGRWSDRASHQVMAAAALLASTVMLAAVAIQTWLPEWFANQWLGMALIFTAAVAHHGARVGRKTYLVDMANQSNRAQYTAVSNTVIGVVLLLGIGLGGLEYYVGVEGVLLSLMGLGLIAAYRALRLPQV